MRRTDIRPCGKSYWKLRLYVAGATPNCISALGNLKRICAECLDAPYRIEVVDLLAHPGLAQGDKIVAIPTLVRKNPRPCRRLIGDLSDRDRVLSSLGLAGAAFGAEGRRDR